MKKIFPVFAALALFACSVDQPTVEETPTEAVAEVQDQRIISLNGTSTEILVELGVQDELVGVDVTSTNLSDATNLGHTSRLSIEAIVNLKPSVIIYKDGELSAQMLEQLNALDVELLKLTPEYTVDALNAMTQQIAKAVGKEEKAAELAIAKDFAEAYKLEKAPKVIFIYARGPGAMQMAGKGTAEGEIIALAGGENPFTFDQYRPVTAEALVAANPDYVLMYDSGYKSLEQAKGLQAIPGMMETTAGKNGALITMDANLLHNFSISLPKAVEELHKAIQ